MSYNFQYTEDAERGEFVKNVGIELRALDHLMMRRLEGQMRSSQGEIITGTNLWIIAYLMRRGEDAVYQRDLEMEFGITRSTASKVLQLMEQKELIRRENAQHDGRMRTLHLTERAREIAGALRQEGENIDQCLTEGFSEQEIATFLKCLKHMKQNLLRKER